MSTEPQPEQAHELPQRLINDLATASIPEEAFISTKHFANVGDIFASLGSVKRLYEATQRRVKYHQVVGQEAQYYPGATHPIVDERGVNVCTNSRVFEMAKPLIEAQSYIYSFEQYNGQHIDIDFDVIRGKTDVALPNGLIQSWITYAYPDLAFDISKPWISIPDETTSDILEQVKGKVILNFTERYRSHIPIDYFFLKNYAPDLIFSGTEREHWLFCNKWQLNDVPLLKIDNWLEIAQALKASRFLLSNQSSHWNLSTAMATPRVLEVCKWAFNCHPNIGENNYGGFYQTSIEYYFRIMYNKTKNAPAK